MRIEIFYSPSFVRQLRGLPAYLQEEALGAIDLFYDIKNHQQLRAHKLHGRLKGRYSFSVNYRYRIVFQYQGGKQEAVLLSIGDHAVYDK